MSSVVDFKRIKNVNKRSKLTVYGFVHQYEALYLSQIIDIILYFYYLTDEWDPTQIGQDLQLLDHDTLKINASESHCGGSAYLTNIISHGIFSWRFKIIQGCDEMNFGIYKYKKKIKNSYDRFYNEPNNGYAYCAFKSFGELMDPTKYGYYMLEEYGANCNDGDVVEMTLDLYERTLSFKVNDVDYGVAFNDIEYTQYRAAIFMYVYDKGDSACIQLLH